MKRQFAFLPLTATILFASISLFAQSNNPITLNVTGGLTTSPLATPGLTNIVSTCPGGVNAWNYSFVAVDAAGGTTNAGTATISTNCSTLTLTSYNAITTTPVVGSVTCNIYRAAGPGSGTQGLIAHIACGAAFLDQSMPTPGAPVPVANSTGSVYGTTMTAQAFTAGSGGSGAGAGTDIMMSGSALSSCPGTSGSISCIPVNGAFFQQAANGFGGNPSLGITWPTSLASSISGTFTGPFLFSAATGSPLTSQVAVGSLSDSADPMLATALAPFTDQSLAILSKNGSTGYDVASSTIVLSGGKIPNAGLVNSAVTFNGQSVSLGLTGNVNAGNVAHTVSLNEGNGAQLGATGIDTTTTHALFAGASDPGFRAIASGDLPTIPIAGGGTNTTTASPGTMLNATSGTASTWTATPMLGATTGTLGTIAFGNSTSGSITLSPPATGALGAVSLTMPSTSGTLLDSAGTNTGTASMTLDLSSSTSFKVPVSTTCSSATDGAICYDSSTKKNTHIRAGGADAIAGAFATAPTSSGDCLIATVSGGNVLLGDFTHPCMTLAGDLNNTYSSPQVTATHLSSALPVNQGGTASTNGAVTNLCAGASAVTATPTGVFLGFGISNVTESKVALPVPVSGTISAIHVVAGTSPPTMVTITFTARYTGMSPISCSITGTTATTCDGTGTQAIGEGGGNSWDIEAVSSGSGTPIAQSYAVCLKVIGAN